MYYISTSSTTDMPADFFKERDIPVGYFKFIMDGKSYLDDFGNSMPLADFYTAMDNGAAPTTSQLNESDYMELLDPILSSGNDVIHIELSSGISGAYSSGKIAEETLRSRYPDRKIYVIDSLAASAGFGLLVEAAADMRDSGLGVDECAAWIEENKLRVHHWFYTSELKHFKRGGRVSAPAAFFGSLLNICPLMNVDYMGKLIPRSKIRGKKHVAVEAVERMKQFADDRTGYNGRILISHSGCPDDAGELAALLRDAFPKMESLRICNIGTVIGSHTGPGTVALFFWGDKRTD